MDRPSMAFTGAGDVDDREDHEDEGHKLYKSLEKSVDKSLNLPF